MFEEIKETIDKIIGEPRKETSDWLEYNCPYCAIENNGEPDNKFNLALNLYGNKHKQFFHCWKCGESGKISKLIKTFGDSSDLKEYFNSIKNIREQLLYRSDNFENLDILLLDVDLELPSGYRKIKNTDKYAVEVIEYLKERNIDEKFIEKYNIGYVPYWDDNKNMRSRVIIPSYDEFGELNYYIARDYTKKRKYRKYNNPEIPKTNFVFNECLINWYEDVTLVEGVFDHMVIPNSIPLLGKSLKREDMVYRTLIQKAKQNVNILLDDDAVKDALKIYKLLENGPLKGRVRIIYTQDGLDASDIYQIYGREGVKQLLLKAEKVDEYDLYVL